MVIVNADVRTMAGERFEHGYIHMDGGKIVSVGPMERAPRPAARAPSRSSKTPTTAARARSTARG